MTASAAKFQFSVVALDAYTKVFRDVNRKAAQSIRPLQQVGRSAAALGREMHLDKAAKGLQSMAKAASSLMESLGVGSPALRAVGAVGGLLGLGAGLAAAAGAAGYLGVRVGNLGTNVTRTSYRLGMSTSTLQRFKGAADLAGVGADTMQQALEALGQTMQDARFNRNPGAGRLFGAFTGGVAVGPNGTNLVGEQMLRVLQAGKGMHDPFAQQKFLEGLGLSSDLMPLLGGGRAGMGKLMDEAERRGAVLTGDALEKAVKFNGELWKLHVAFDGLTNTLGVRLLPALTSITSFFDRLVQHPLLTVLGITPTSGHGSGARAPAGAADAPGAAAGGSSLPLGLRLNNPGNIRVPGSSTFRNYATPQLGLNAMAQLLTTYQDMRGLNTISGIIGRWAPAADGNNVGSYVSDVSRRTGFGADQALNLHDPGTLTRLMRAMEAHEQRGVNPFTDQQYAAAAAHTVKIEVVGDMPTGVNVRASVNGAYVPTRIDRALATGSSVE